MARPGLLAALLPTALVIGSVGCGRTPFDGLERDFLEEADLDLDEDPVSQGCRKVDYLFVIDNSASMADNQLKLVESFGVFIEGVQRSQATLESVHVGVVTTDAYVASPPECHALGGLVSRTEGHNSSDAECGPYAEGHNYMTERDDLATTFPCAAQVGTSGNNQEYPLEALTSAVTKFQGEGECNEGFIRDDALLVVVVVTDEDDPGLLDHRYDKLVDAKGGRSDNVVVVSLVNEPGTDCSLQGHAKVATNLVEFAGYFEHSFVHPVCGDYAEAFERAIGVVEAACWD